MRAKPDLSRLVMLTLSPTEAAVMAGVLTVFIRKSEGLHSAELELLEGTIDRIARQLKALHWPLDKAKQAPYPL